QLRRARRDEGVAVDLPVRVLQRDPDLLPAVLEGEHLLDAGQRRERGRAVGPRLDHRAHPRHRQRPERRVVVAGEAHHLAAPDGGPLRPERVAVDLGRHLRHRLRERREAVLEHYDVVARRRDLRRLPARQGGVQRAVVGGRHVRAVLAVRGDRHPLAGEHVEPHGGAVGHVREVARVRQHLALGRDVVEVEELTSVGHRRRCLLHAHAASTTRPQLLSSTCRASGWSPPSLTTTSTSLNEAIVLNPTTPHLELSATTATRRALATSARFVSASARFGVVNPASASMPCTPISSQSTCSRRSAATDNGPTSASDGVRSPPVRTTIMSSPPDSYSTSATRSELVTTVSRGIPIIAAATACVVVPADSATDAPGSSSCTAAAAIACFAAVCKVDVAANPGSSTLLPAAVAPPCTRVTSPRSASASMS